MQHVAHARRGRVGQHDEPQIARRLVVVQFVLPRAVADEGVVVAAQLAHHVAQREDGAEDQLGVVPGLGACRPSVRASSDDMSGGVGGRRVGTGGCGCGRDGRGGCRRKPALRIDALRVPVEDVEGEDGHFRDGGPGRGRAGIEKTGSPLFSLLLLLLSLDDVADGVRSAKVTWWWWPVVFSVNGAPGKMLL